MSLCSDEAFDKSVDRYCVIEARCAEMSEEAKVDVDESLAVDRARRLWRGESAVGVIGAFFLRASSARSSSLMLSRHRLITTLI